jgi:PilZ domain
VLSGNLNCPIQFWKFRELTLNKLAREADREAEDQCPEQSMWTIPGTSRSGAKVVPENAPPKKQESPAVVSIPVRVSGVDLAGNPFTQTAQALEVSGTGARIGGIRCLRETGEMVTIECGTRCARFVVVWIGEPGSANEGQFGAKALEPEKRIFPIDTAETRPDEPVSSAEAAGNDFALPPKPAEKWDQADRRTAPRIACSGTGEIRQTGVAFPVWAEVADLSLGGCYVQMVFTIPCQSEVDVQLTIGERSFAARGRVVTSYPGVGMGIQFTALTQENQKILAAILQELTAK